MQTVLARFKKLIPLLVVLVILALGWWLYYAVFTFHVTGTNPKMTAVSMQTPYIKINFSQPISTNNLSVLASDPAIMANYEVSGKQLTINLQSLYNVSYVVTVKHIQSTKGKNLDNLTFRFTPQYIEFQNLPKSQQDTLLKNQDKTPAVNNDPIFNYVPHSTLDYNLTAVVSNDSQGQSTVGLQAQLLLSAADVNSGQDAAVATYKQEVLDYLKSVGLNPDKYTITYTVVTSN